MCHDVVHPTSSVEVVATDIRRLEVYPPMFLGEYRHTLDAKGRLTVPARYRATFEPGLVVTRGHEPCLTVYPLDEWNKLAAKVAQLPVSNLKARAYSRWLFAGAFEAVPDKMGRILIPSFLRDYAGISAETVIAGVNTTVEIWSPERWEARWLADQNDMDNILHHVGELGI